MPYYDLEIAFSKIYRYVDIEIMMACFFTVRGAFTNYVDKRR